MEKRILKYACLSAGVLLGSILAYQGMNKQIENRVDHILEERIYQYENEIRNAHREHAHGIIDNIVPLRSFIKYSTPLKQGLQTTRIDSDGLIVNYEENDYIITVAHNVSRDRIISNTGVYPGTTLYSETSWNGIDLEHIYRNPEKDVAIFRFPDEVPRNFEMPEYDISLGDSDSLQKFDDLYLIGNPALSGTHIREGIVANSEEDRSFRVLGNFSSKGVGLSMPARPGDSGRPVVRPYYDPIDGHGLELIGLLKESHHSGMSGYMAPINWFKDNM